MLKTAQVLFATAFVLVGCSVEKTGQGEYTAKTDTSVAARETAEAKQDAVVAGREVKEGAKEVGRDVREGAQNVANSPAGQQMKAGAQQVGEGIATAARGAAAATGSALESAGKNIQEHSKKGDQ